MIPLWNYVLAPLLLILAICIVIVAILLVYTLIVQIIRALIVDFKTQYALRNIEKTLKKEIKESKLKSGDNK